MKFNDYKDKVKACWLGKNIGGTLGAPFESYRKLFDAEFYTHDLTQGVLPNDDLDLQLVWLNAAERFGKNVNAEILGQYWAACVVARWSEYSAGLANLEYGMLPPASGIFQNEYAESNGAFIRSELWACLAPGNPEIAVKYAYEDAIVDHTGEGTYAELFCAAMQSAAFVESDRDTLINIGLSYIPEDCAVAKAIAFVRTTFADGMNWKDARLALLNEFPCTFGLMNGEPEGEIKVGKLGYDAPASIGLIILGWLYGENDFSKCICIAANCGEDADCTAGTLAATLGIIGGTAALPQKWLEPIGDEIKTVAINRADNTIDIPETTSSLTERVVKLMPVFLNDRIKLDENGAIEIKQAENLYNAQLRTGIISYRPQFWYMYDSDIVAKKGSFPIQAYLRTEDLFVTDGIEKKFSLMLVNHLQRHLWADVRVHAPTEWTGNTAFSVRMNQFTGGNMVTEAEFVLLPENLKAGTYKMVIEITTIGYPCALYLPVVFVKK